MNKDKQTTEYLEKIADMKLSDSSRERMQSELMEYARFHAVSDGVRVSENGRSIEHVPQRTSLFSVKFIYMPFALLLAVLVGGGTSFAAQGAIPGDFLYPVKTEVNEPVRSAFAIGTNAEVRLQTKLVAERVAEAQELEERGELTGELAAQLATSIREHAGETGRLMVESDADVRAESSTQLALSLERFNTLVENDALLAINVSPVSSDIETETDTTTMLATRSIDPEAMRLNTTERVENLTRVVVDSEAQLSAEVFVSLTDSLEEANELLVESRTQAEVQAQQSLMEAAELVGEVEAELTTLGTAEIDATTGAIIGIDFSNVPSLEVNIGADGRAVEDDAPVEEDTQATDSDSDNDGEVEADVELEVNLDGSGLDGAVRSGLSL